METYISSALGAFRLLVRDYEKLLEYVHPDVANVDSYSHRTYELLLRACTEFESLAKGKALELGIINTTDQPNINTLSTLLSSLDLEHVEVTAIHWVPSPLVMRPLHGWDMKPHALAWYRSYNNVKHNRAEKFSEASLQMATNAIAACFILLVRLNGIRFSIENHIHLPENRIEFLFDPIPFTLRVPDTWTFIDAPHPIL